MSNEIDERLLALFAGAQETLPGAEFMQSFLARMQRARRRQSMRRIALAVALGALAAWIMPSVLATTATVVHVVGEQSRPYGALIISPAGWAISMLIGFLVLLRTGALRRR
ncbi:MAG TPA: hypothetical protein VGI32_18215 [Steroidobacteraceae bacterium]|jgi:sterol desaturase/sphingolipid hydroxylase (fatty acid hydroxylase superfamily)